MSKVKKLFCTVYGLEPNPNQNSKTLNTDLYTIQEFLCFRYNLSISIFFSKFMTIII